LDEITNYIDNALLTRFNPSSGLSYEPLRTDRGWLVLGALSMPRYEMIHNRLTVNTVVAKMRAMSGSAAEQNLVSRAVAFSYVVQPEITPFNGYPTNSLNFSSKTLSVADRVQRSNEWVRAQYLAANLHELKLTLRWPVVGTNTVDGGWK